MSVTMRLIVGPLLIVAGCLIYYFKVWRRVLWYYIEFHADNGSGCTAGRRRFADPRDADKFWDWIKADKYHRCNDHRGFSDVEKLPEIGWLKGRYNTHPDRASLLKLTTVEPDAVPPKQIATLKRLQKWLPKIAHRTGCIQTPYGVMYFYSQAWRVPKGAGWPKRSWPWLLLLYPLCLWNNNLVCRCCSSER